MSQSRDRRAALTPKQRELLARRLRAEAKPAKQVVTRRRGAAEAAPLSFAQERLWFLDLWQPGSAAYNLVDVVEIEGPLSVGALAAALHGILARHEALRSEFVDVAGIPVQRPVAAAKAGVRIIDLRSLVAERRNAVARELARRESLRPFDLARPPHLRALLLRTAAREHLLTLSLHHIVSDLWSFAVFLREFGLLYRRGCEGETMALPVLPLQYADYAAWQREWFSGEVEQAHLEYWRGQLAGAPLQLELAADRPRPPLASGAGSDLSFFVEPALAAAVALLGRQANATPFMVLLAVFAILLGRQATQPDLLVGTPTAGRGQRELEGLIGLFINTLVFRVRPAEALSFSDLLAQVRETAVGAFTYQEMPFDRLVEDLQPVRDPSRSPVIQVLFALQSVAIEPLSLPGLSWTPVTTRSSTAKVDLSLALAPLDDGFAATLEYSTELFDRTRIERLRSHFLALLAAVSARPALPLGAISLLSPAEHAQLAREWNDVADAGVPQESLAVLCRRQAALRPDSVAVVFGEQHWSRQALTARAMALAGVLCRAGVGPEVPVALLLERSPELVIAMLAVSEAGGTYLPIDLAYPAERRRLILEDAGAAVVLVGDEEAAGLGSGRGGADFRVLRSSEWPRGAGENERAPDPSSWSDGAAYVIYTSGSTGKPKGVLVEQAAVRRLVLATNYVRLGAESRIAQASNCAFDAATFEIWGALLCGGRLIGIERTTLLSPEELAGFLIARRVTTLFVTTALFNQLVREVAHALAPLDEVLFGGEAVDPSAVSRLMVSGPPRRLLHVYGPTESTTFSSWYRVAEPPGRAATVPIGAAVGNTTLFIATREGRLQALGLPGELLIGGDGLARGYHQRRGLTAERFVPDPFGERRGARLYRSGDLARWRSDGALEFLGRFDHQVKIRGFRIELGEVEAGLTALPEIREAIVLVVEKARGDKQLVAYVSLASGTTAGAEEIKRSLQRFMPPYMVPSQVMILAALPQNANGKIDREALPDPATLEVEAVRRSHRELSPSEELLSVLWCELLELSHVGPDDDFFALGGHSLLATRVVARIRETFGVDLPLRALFDAPKLAELARHLEQLHGGAEPEPPLSRRADGLPPRLSFAQERLWFLDRLYPGSTAYNIPGAVELRGELDVAALCHAWRRLVERHEALRTTFTIAAGQPVQVIHAPEALRPRLPLLDLSWLGEPAARGVARRLAPRLTALPFNLERGPLLSLLLLRLAPDTNALAMAVHHIVADGWSLSVLVRELSHFYAAELMGRDAAPLPELPIQYADYALWQRQWLEGGVLSRQLEYWRGELAGAPPLLALPTDRPRPPVQSFAGGAFKAVIDHQLKAGLEQLSRRQGVTLFMTLLAVLELELATLSGSSDLVVGTAIAGRARPATEGLIGLFVNTLLLRGRISGEATFEALLAAARETALGAYAHQDVPFERLVQLLAPERDLSRSPLCQVLLVLQNTPPLRLAAAGLDIVELEPEAGSGTAKLDLSVVVVPSPSGLTILYYFNRDLFDEVTIERWSRQFNALLRQAVAAPERRLGSFHLLTEQEREQLDAWNRTDRSLPAVGGVLEWFEEQVRHRPEAVAVAEAERQVSFFELDRAARAVAGWLRREGLGAERVVALLAARGPDFLAALLGILRAGGVYMPLDPHHPPGRMAQLLGQSRAAVVLADEALVPLAEQALDLLPAPRPELGALEPVLRGEASTEPLAPFEPERLAYVIFTSGSTGVPKGAMVTHQGTINHLVALLEVLDIVPGDVVAQTAQQSFDISVWQFLVAPVLGCRVRIYNDVVIRDPRLLLDRVAAEGVTILETVPSLLRLMLADVARRGSAGLACEQLRWLLPTGEALPPDLAAEWTRSFPAIALLNVYGPAECADDVTTFRVPAAMAETAITPIGRPILNTRIYLCDARLRLLPWGVPGELVIGGIGVGRGYLADPRRTALAFVPDPFGELPGARLYRTGDLARLRNDGELEFLGRLDHQVKVRGFRIELGEIEAALLDAPTVKDAVVIKHDDGGEARLVAYVVVTGDLDEAALKAHLAARLPDYMVPPILVELESLPLSPNGKVDRRALPAPLARLAARAGGRGLATPVERWLAELWAKVLPVGEISSDTDFFTAGGSSLSGAVFINELQGLLGEIVHVVKIFDASVLKDFAAYLEAEHAASLARVLGLATEPARAPETTGIDVAAVARLAPHLPRASTRAVDRGAKNRPAVFVLSPPRSGSTLLRVMLAGNPRLFGPPELELLSFATLGERREAFQGRDAYRLEGAIRAWMEIFGISADQAKAALEALEEEDLAVGSFFALLQEGIGERLLVEKTASYAWDLETLRRAEELFEQPLYLHLIRHPGGTMHSFEEAKLDQIYFAGVEGFSRRQLAELSWWIGHRNILRFREEVPAARVFPLFFETLVAEPERMMRELSAFLGLDFDPGMLQPYEARSNRMTDGLHAQSRMLGDVKFHQHKSIEASVAERWRQSISEASLSPMTLELARQLGVALEAPRRLPESRHLVGIQPGSPHKTPLFLVHPVFGDAQLYRHLASELGAEQPVYAFHALGNGGPARQIEELAERYLGPLREAQPRGPYLLGGGSMGGLVAFEMARRLVAAGEEVGLLALMDSWVAADIPGFSPDPVGNALAVLTYLAGPQPPEVLAELRALPSAERAAAIFDRARAAGALPPSFGLADLEAILATIAANGEAMASYRPEPYPGRLIYFRAAEGRPPGLDPVPSWKKLSRGVVVHEVPGDHDSMLLPPHVGSLALALAAHLVEGGES